MTYAQARQFAVAIGGPTYPGKIDDALDLLLPFVDDFADEKPTDPDPFAEHKARASFVGAAALTYPIDTPACRCRFPKCFSTQYSTLQCLCGGWL